MTLIKSDRHLIESTPGHVTVSLHRNVGQRNMHNLYNLSFHCLVSLVSWLNTYDLYIYTFRCLLSLLRHCFS